MVTLATRSKFEEAEKAKGGGSVRAKVTLSLTSFLNSAFGQSEPWVMQKRKIAKRKPTKKSERDWSYVPKKRQCCLSKTMSTRPNRTIVHFEEDTTSESESEMWQGHDATTKMQAKQNHHNFSKKMNTRANRRVFHHEAESTSESESEENQAYDTTTHKQDMAKHEGSPRTMKKNSCEEDVSGLDTSVHASQVEVYLDSPMDYNLIASDSSQSSSSSVSSEDTAQKKWQLCAVPRRDTTEGRIKADVKNEIETENENEIETDTENEIESEIETQQKEVKFLWNKKIKVEDTGERRLYIERPPFQPVSILTGQHKRRVLMTSLKQTRTYFPDLRPCHVMLAKYDQRERAV